MDSDTDLEAIRAKRLQQLQGNRGGPQNAANSEENEKRQKESQAKEEEFRNTILSQVLTQEARGRLGNIAVAKPDKAKELENMIINMARYGQIRGKLSDDQFKDLLGKITEQTQKSTTVKFDRRRAAIDSDSD